MVVLAALIKPQFVVLAVAFVCGPAMAVGRHGGPRAGVFNLAAYALWPQNFPGTIMDSFRNAGDYGGSFQRLVGDSNVSYAKGLFTIPDYIRAGGPGGKITDGFIGGPAMGHRVRGPGAGRSVRSGAGPAHSGMVGRADLTTPSELRRPLAVVIRIR